MGWGVGGKLSNARKKKKKSWEVFPYTDRILCKYDLKDNIL